MTLTFLGQTYEASTVEVAPVTSTATGRYRGTPVQFSGSQVAPRANVTLTYRGIRYTR